LHFYLFLAHLSFERDYFLLEDKIQVNLVEIIEYFLEFVGKDFEEYYY
jgi:hypothetical protein